MKSSLAVASFEDSARTLVEGFLALEKENAELKLKLSVALQRLAVFEPDVTEALLLGVPESPAKKVDEDGKKKTEDPKADPVKTEGPKSEGPSKFRAVKDFLFKSKPKTAEDEAKARSSKAASKDEFVGPDPKRKGSAKNKPDRWVYLRSLEGHSQAVLDISLCAYDPFLLGSASRDGTVRLWHLEGAAGLFCGHKGQVNSVRIHPSGQSRLVCSAGVDGSCQVFRIPTFMVHLAAASVSRVHFAYFVSHCCHLSGRQSLLTITRISQTRPR
jgi:WD40 repeat protein